MCVEKVLLKIIIVLLILIINITKSLTGNKYIITYECEKM